MIFQMTSSCWFPTKELNIKLSRAEASCSGSIRTIRISSNMQNVVAEEPPLLRKILKPSGESGGDWPEAHQAPVQLRRRGVSQPSVLRALQAVSEERLRLQEYFSWSRKTGFIKTPYLNDNSQKTHTLLQTHLDYHAPEDKQQQTRRSAAAASLSNFSAAAFLLRTLRTSAGFFRRTKIQNPRSINIPTWSRGSGRRFQSDSPRETGQELKAEQPDPDRELQLHTIRLHDDPAEQTGWRVWWFLFRWCIFI